MIITNSKVCLSLRATILLSDLCYLDLKYNANRSFDKPYTQYIGRSKTIHWRFHSNRANTKFSLTPVGKFNLPKVTGNYETGQLFLHKIFGYRGVVLFPWPARVFNRDTVSKKPFKEVEVSEVSVDSSDYKEISKEVKGRPHTFYQVLIDNRDCPYVRAETGVTFLGDQNNGMALYALSGLDYVAHEDVIPYTANDDKPIQHDLFDKFLETMKGKDPAFTASTTLKKWQERNRWKLELSDVHIETTDHIRVTVIPFYMGCRTAQDNNAYWWRYCVRLENLGEMTVQLRKRDWRIFSSACTLDIAGGNGVVGQEPVLSPEHPAFQYSSHVRLQAPSGHMWGTFKMEREDGHVFKCKIPPFSLESKTEEADNKPDGYV